MLMPQSQAEGGCGTGIWAVPAWQQQEEQQPAAWAAASGQWSPHSPPEDTAPSADGGAGAADVWSALAAPPDEPSPSAQQQQPEQADGGFTWSLDESWEQAAGAPEADADWGNRGTAAAAASLPNPPPTLTN